MIIIVFINYKRHTNITIDAIYMPPMKENNEMKKNIESHLEVLFQDS